MKILYISSISNNIASGLSWSVPASVHAQEQLDDCLWVNTTETIMPHWNNTKCFHRLSDYGDKLALSILPAPFNHPDMVVFEGFYKPEHPKFAKELRKNDVPYIIVPRCSLTDRAMNNHAKWKKRIAHFLIFDKYVHRAAAIQYLTEDEYRDSGDKWNQRHIIIPNGFSKPSITKSTFNKDRLVATFIGRLDIYHKGIDCLLEAIRQLKPVLKAVNFSLCLYGPRKFHYDQIHDLIAVYDLTDMVTMGGEIVGQPKEKALLASDLFVLTSRFEGHPMGLIEALAYGVPSMVTPGSNMAREINSENAGWTCNETSVSAISDMLQQVISERSEFETKSKNAIRLAGVYDWNRLADKFHESVENIIKEVKS